MVLLASSGPSVSYKLYRHPPWLAGLQERVGTAFLVVLSFTAFFFFFNTLFY